MEKVKNIVDNNKEGKINEPAKLFYSCFIQ